MQIEQIAPVACGIAHVHIIAKQLQPSGIAVSEIEMASGAPSALRLATGKIEEFEAKWRYGITIYQRSLKFIFEVWHGRCINPNQQQQVDLSCHNTHYYVLPTTES